MTHLTRLYGVARWTRSEGIVMITHSFGPGSTPSDSYSGSPAWNQAYVVAALRAGLIAVALLAVLTVIVLS